MGSAWLVSMFLRGALVLAASGIGAALLWRGTAAARHRMWALGVLAALAMPVLVWTLPSVFSVGVPAIDVGRTIQGAAIRVTAGTAGAAPIVWTTWPWLAMVWAAGAVVVAVRIVRGHLAARRLALRSEPARAETWFSAARSAAAALGFAGDVDLRRSSEIESPMTIGVLRPRVVLPAAAEDWSPERLRAVLVHELGHALRRDLLIQLGAQLACALHWCNPLAWLASRRLRIEREHACDDLVLGTGVRPSSYAADLLALSRAVASAPLERAGACMADSSRISVRLGRILDAAAPRTPLGVAFRIVTVSVALACTVTVACTSASAEQPASSEPRNTAPAASAASVSIGPPSAYDGGGPLSYRPQVMLPEDTSYLSLVATEVQRRADGLKACFERRLQVSPDLAGEVVIHWTITPDGKVPDQCITRDTVNDFEVAACVNALVAAGPFPAPRGGAASVSFPFVFRSR